MSIRITTYDSFMFSFLLFYCRNGRSHQKNVFYCAEYLMEEEARNEQVYEQVMQMRLSFNPLKIVKLHKMLSLLGPMGLTNAINQHLQFEKKSTLTSRIADSFAARINNITQSSSKIVNIYLNSLLRYSLIFFLIYAFVS